MDHYQPVIKVNSKDDVESKADISKVVMTLPGVNSLVSLSEDLGAANSTDLSYIPPLPADTSVIRPQARIDTSRLLDNLNVSHNAQVPLFHNAQLPLFHNALPSQQQKQPMNTIFPKINSPFLVTAQHRNHQQRRATKSHIVRSNTHRNTKAECSVTESPQTHRTLLEWLTEFRLMLGLDMTPVRYPSPSPPLPPLLDSLSDEQEVRCYCIPNPDSPLDPYDLILAEYGTASARASRSCYYSASPSSILVFDEEGLSGVASVGRWLWERGMFYSLRRLRFFSQARQRKVFRAWTKFHSVTKMQRVKKSLLQKLYIVRPDYQQLLREILVYMHEVSPVSSRCYSEPLSVLRGSHLRMFWLDLLQTKSMSELRTAVAEHFLSVTQRVEAVKRGVVDKLAAFAEQMGATGMFSALEDSAIGSNFSDVILNRKRLQDFSFFIKLSDLLLHQHLRELCLIGAASLLSILRTSVQDAQHESNFGEEEQFRVMVLAIRKNRVKMSGQLQDISHGIVAVAETGGNLLDEGLVSRRHTQPFLDHKPEILLHKITEKIPAGVMKLVDELKGPSPALLRVTLQLVTSAAEARAGELPLGDYRMRLDPSKDEICDFISDIHSELWRIANEYRSITEDPRLEKYMCWFPTTSLCDMPPFSNSVSPPVASPESSTSLLTLLDKITPCRVNEFVESTHSMSHSAHSCTYRLRPDLSSLASTEERKHSKRVQISNQELRENMDPTLRREGLDNFERTLVTYWEKASSCMEDNLVDVSLYCDAYQHYCLILDYCVMVLAQTANPSETWGPEKLEHYLSFAESQEECVNLMVQSFRSGALRVDTIDLYRTCKPFPELIVRDLTEHIRNVQKQSMTQLTEKIKYANFQLQLTINDVGSCANHLYFLDHMQQELGRIQDAYSRMNRYYKIIQDYDLEYPDEERAHLQATHPWYNVMLSEVAEAELKKESTIKQFSDLISNSLNEICKEAEKMKLSVSSQHFLEESSGYESVYLDLSRYMREVEHLLTQTAELQRYGQQLLYQKGALLKKKKKRDQYVAEPASFAGERLNNLHNSLREVLSEISMKQLMWSTWKKWRDLTSSWNHLELSKLDTADIHRHMVYFNQMSIVFKSGLPQNSLWKSVHEELSAFEEILPVLTCVTGPAIQERHWTIINKMLKQEINIHQMTLEEFLKLDLLSKKERIVQEALIAVQERHSEELFNKITEVWSTYKLTTVKKDDIYLLVDVDCVLALIEDSIINLNLIKSSKYLGPIKKEVESWDVSLCQMLATIKTWFRFQQGWSELETIFSSIDMRHDLALIFRDFKHVDRSFHEFSSKYISSREVNAMKIATSPGILESFQSHIVQLERVSRSLDDYLENKRTSFSRFYFLSREELLQVIFNPSDTSIVRPYLSKLFGSVQQLQLISGYNPDISNIHGVVSKEGEVLKLERLVPAKNTSSKWWIANLLMSLKEKVCYSISEAHSLYEQTILEDWAYGQFSGQAILVSLFITWTLEVEKELSAPTADLSPRIRSLCTLRNNWQQGIHRIANSFSNKKYSHLQLGMNIIIVQTYFRDVLNSLIELPLLQGLGDYNWSKVLRYYLEDPTSVWVEQFLGRFRYCNEYLGCSPRLVLTPLTERAFRHMSTAMHFNMGAAFFGSTGTGKTETARDFAKVIGNMCFSYNCTVDTDCRMLSQYLSGIISSGSLGCFDDFHKLATPVLSVVIHHMQVIKMSRDAKKNTVSLNARDILLAPSSAYFITMNYMFHGSSELSDIVLSSLRPCAMFEADVRIIVEVLLYTFGFTAATSLAKKLSALFKLAELNLSQEIQYNFGMRTIKQVIDLASNRKKVFYINWKNVCVPLETVESLLLVRCIQDIVLPRLLDRDLLLFKGLLSDHFPSLPKISTDQSVVEKLIDEIVQEKKLEKWEPQIHKVIELFLFMKQSTGIMLVGSSGTGKTVCLQILARLLDLLSLPLDKRTSAIVPPSDSGNKIVHSGSTTSSSSQNMHSNNMFASYVRSKVFAAHINAKAFSLDEFYGKVDQPNSEDCIGIFPKILKSFLSDLTPSEESNDSRRFTRATKIEPREMVFEGNNVIYKPRNENDADDSGVPLLNTTSFKSKKPSDSFLGRNTSSHPIKKLSKRTKSSLAVEDVLKKGSPSAMRKSQSFTVLNGTEMTDSLNPATSGGLSAPSKDMITSPMDFEKQIPSEWRWIVFDGPIDTEWVEHLNPALDDTKVMCLNNGERLQISDGIRFIFETESLKFANPSIVSRCSIAYFSEKNLGWKPIFNSWMSSIPSSVPDKVRTFLKSIAEYSVPQAIEFISELHNQPLSQLSYNSYINTLCNILNCLLFYLVENKTFGDTVQLPAGRQWGHHVKTSSVLSNVSADASYYSTAGIVDNKQTLSLVFEQEEEHTSQPTIPQICSDVLDTLQHLPDSVMMTLRREEHTSQSSLTYLQKNPDELMTVLGRLYVFAFVWSFGAPLDCYDLDEFQSPEGVYTATDELVLRGGSSGRAKFDKFVYQLFSNQGPHKISLPNSTRPIFSYYVDLDNGRFTLWDSLVMEEKDIITGIPNTSYHLTTKKMEVVYHYLAKEPGLREPVFQGISLVPTLDAVRTTFLTCLLASRGYPVILVGQHAAGISMYMRSALDMLTQHGGKDVFVSSILGGQIGSNEFENVFSKTKKESDSKFYKSEIKLFFDLSAHRLQQQIESQLVKRRNKLIGRTGKKLLLFLDDLNSPKSDRYNVSPCMALVSSLLDSGGLYERGSGRWRWLFDFITMGTYRLTSNSTQQLTGKFLRQFNSILLPSPTEATIKHIFGVAVSLFLINVQFNRDIILMADNVVSAMTFVYKSACNTFKPSPSNPHYTFNIRDLAKVFLGMQQCTPEFVKSGDDLINLFTHECNRVIHDRLTEVEQKEEYFEIMHNALRIHCKVVRSPSKLQNEETLFGDFSQTHTKLSVSYQPLPPIKTISAILDEHFLRSTLPYSNELPIFFDVAVQNIMRVYRVLKIPGANMIMIGLPASGKRSALSLAAHLAGYEIIMPHKDGEEKSITEFDSLLKQLFRDAGVKGVKLAIYLAGRFLEQNQHILSSISYVITQGCTTQFFSDEEIREIKSSISTVDFKARLETPWHRFVSSVNANFHIFISVSQSDRILSLLCRDYPDVISHCTVNHFAEWPAQARASIAMKFLRKLETDKFVRPAMLQTISTTCSDIYHGVLRLIKNLEAKTCWKTYATTASFIEMLRLFSTSAQFQHSKLSLRLQQLRTTVARFSEADHEVNELSKQLNRARTRLIQKESDIEHLLKRIKWDESQFLIHRKRFEAIEVDKANQAIATKDITKEATQNYEQLRPEMEEALREIQLLKKSDIVEIRLYSRPPDIVQQVMTALCLLLQQPSDWNTIKHLLADRGFIQMIISFDKDHVSDVILEKLQVYIRDPRLHPDNVDKVSGACKSICKWMFAIEKYCRVYRLVEPRRQDYYRSKQLEADIREELKKAHEKLIETEKSLRRNEAAHRKALSDKRNLHTRLDRLEDKLKRANFLRTSLEEEQVRCEGLLEELTERKKTFLGDCLISSAGISYLGPFPIYNRHDLLSIWIDLCRVGKIPLSPTYSFSKHLLSEEHYEIWYTQGLPRDRGSIENAVLIERGLRWPLIIDPQQLARTWIEKRESANNLVVSDYANVNLSQSIALAIENKRPLLIQNIPETLPLSLDNLLMRDFPTENTDASLSNYLFEPSKQSKFRLYMTCNLPFPQFAPYVYIRTSVINFSISEESMEDLLLSEAVALEEPELNSLRVVQLRNLPSSYEELWAINEKIDSLLQLEVFAILDNASFSHSLASNLDRRREIQINLGEARATQDELNKIKSKYGAIAKRGSLLYSIACDLAQLDHMYQFSIVWFIRLFKSCFESETVPYSSYRFSRRVSTENGKMSHILDNLTYTFYLQIGRAIFSEHLLPFSITLCAQLLINSPQREECSLTNEEWNFFLYGHTRGVISDGPDKTTSSNISRLLMPLDSRGSVTPPKNSIPIPSGLSELTSEMWKRCEDLEKQLPQAFISLRQYITLNTRLWKHYLAERFPFTFNFDPLNLTELPNPELGIIEEERESEESEEKENDQAPLLSRPGGTTPLISILSISKSPTSIPYECDFEPDFLTHFHKLILVKELRRDSLVTSIRSFISETIGAEFIQTPVVDLIEVFNDSSSISKEFSLVPILLIYSHDSTSYKDMIGDLELLAENKFGSSAKLTHLVFVERRVSQSFSVLKREAMRGGWVLCTNVHLQLTWLTNLIEHLMLMSRHGQKVHPDFRLWLTTKACSNFPISILHHSLKLRIESMKNLKVCMKETLLDRGAISHLDLKDQGAGPYWRRVLFTLCFFNTFIRCRNRYKTIGWNYVYDFGIRDFKCAKYMVHKLMTDHSSIPWAGIIESLSDTCYGGRIIDQKDRERLECILAQFFNSDITTDNFKFLKDSINFPMISDESDFEGWKSHIELLPVNDSPESLGIHRSADILYSMDAANSLLRHLCEINHSAAGTGRSGLVRDAVMQKSSVIFNSLPSKAVLPDLGSDWTMRVIDSINVSDMETGYDSHSADSSLLLVLSREIEMYQKLLDLISSSVEELQYSRSSNVLMSNEMEGLYHDIKHDVVPRHWRCLCYPTTRKLASFILDLKQRCRFFSDWHDLLNSPRKPEGSGKESPAPPKEILFRPRSFWLGAFFYPNCFLTALKQLFCRQRRLSLESIQFQTRVLIERRTLPNQNAVLSQIDEAAPGFTPGYEAHSGALVHGLYLEGCRWDTHQGGLTTIRGNCPISRLPPIHFIPLLKEKKISRKLFYHKMPIYHTAERERSQSSISKGGCFESDFVTHITLPSLKSPDIWCLTNAAILLSPPSYVTSS